MVNGGYTRVKGKMTALTAQPEQPSHAPTYAESMKAVQVVHSIMVPEVSCNSICVPLCVSHVPLLHL
jgi:hypothetical protein